MEEGVVEKPALSWFALRTMPQRDWHVRKVLIHRGLEAYIKTERKFGAWIKGERSEKEGTAAPGYVFAGLSGVNPWALTRDCHMIKSVVSYQGRPAMLDPASLAEFLGFEDESDKTPDYFRFLRKSEAAELPAFAIGDTVRIDTPSFEGFTLPVKNIERGEAIFDLVWGSCAPTELRIPVAQCYKIAEAA